MIRDLLLGALAAIPGAVGRRARFVRTRAALEAGAPARQVEGLVRELVAEAERELGAGRDETAAEALTKALVLLLHPSRALGAAIPPLLEDSAAVLSVLDGGKVGEVLRRPGGVPAAGVDGLPGDGPEGSSSSPEPSASAAGPTEASADRPATVLVLSGGGLSFLRPVMDSWRAAGHEVRTLTADELPAAERPTLRTVVGAAITTWRTGRPAPVPAVLASALEGVDHVHVEWGDQVAAWFSHLDRGARTLSVRIHKYEILTAYPQLLDAARVDSLCFVATHVREAAVAIAPRLAAAPRTAVTANALDLERFADPAPALDLPGDLPSRDRLLALVGWAGPAKDADFALDVLEQLRAQDAGTPWTLLLVGEEPAVTGADAPRARALLARIAAAGDAVRVLGRREDVPAVLARSGWILSASVIEGTHEAVAEGAASACVPVVRDWPQVRAHGGARTVYPESWIVPDDPAAAARRILDHRGRRAAEGEAARAQIRHDRDPDALASAQERWIGPARPHPGGTARPEGGPA
ncbi:glycosyltransferase [Brachybacterium sp. J144]|uniref:glycosyltransferase n=1 Tax=Brachybacterium sp. J144 TaxID=3116487 RepID=UPI002E7A0E82|nr:glycosyltransferase [Brachybacterium sp. J144]MEE1649565.1 glycosyltransferase [Brachybacterium sp. J144]